MRKSARLSSSTFFISRLKALHYYITSPTNPLPGASFSTGRRSEGSGNVIGLRPGGVLPILGYTGRLRPKGVPFLSSQYIKGRENCHFSIQKDHKISCKVKEMVAKAKYIKGSHILAEMTSQLNQND